MYANRKPDNAGGSVGVFYMGESGAPLFTDRKGAGRIPLWIGMSRRRKQDKASAYGLTFP